MITTRCAFGFLTYRYKKFIWHLLMIAKFWHGFGFIRNMKVVFKKTKAVKKDSCTIVSLFAKRIMELKEIHFSTLNLPGFIA
ncbi:hypothetical protein [Mucilaginibacter gilvus]|uniref:hypothetical protein n=1 Tax=Mucilaginibacter gilvus TaxID=2305909 RepID=UPI001ABAA577|nr:hypothetical protein [Mucilaginibacter gilvus]